MGDDVGWFNIGAYHQGVMSGKTPNLDKLVAQGMRFTDYYAQAGCTAGRANFIMGQLPLRSGLPTVGQAGADVGMPGQCVTIRHRTQIARLRNRPVRQEPSRTPEQIFADAAWLRRIL
jgi:arylsulfatase A-like enzyme